MPIFDTVPVKQVHRSKENLSRRVSTTGDLGYVYPMDNILTIANDVHHLGSAHVCKFMPMISPLFTDINADTFAFDTPLRLLDERWENFHKRGKSGNYAKPLKTLQDIFKIYCGYGNAGFGIEQTYLLRDLFYYLRVHFKQMVRFRILDSSKKYIKTYTYSSAPQQLRVQFDEILSSYENFHESFVTHISKYSSTKKEIFRRISMLAWCIGGLIDYLKFPVFDCQFSDIAVLNMTFIETTVDYVKQYKLDLYWLDNGYDTFDTAIVSYDFDYNSDNHMLSLFDFTTSQTFNHLPISYDNFLAKWYEDSWSSFPFLAHWYIYNEWFRHEEFDPPMYCKWLWSGELGIGDNQIELDPDDDDETEITPLLSFMPFTRVYRKDYFTSSLLSSMRGTPPALPIHSSSMLPVYGGSNVPNTHKSTKMIATGGSSPAFVTSSSSNPVMNNVLYADSSKQQFVTFDISDLRLANAVTRFMELNNSIGTRYSNFLLAHYGTAPSDEALQKPYYIGKTSCPVLITELDSTTATDTDPLGSRAGKAQSVDTGRFKPYHCKEPSVLSVFFSLLPDVGYTSQGVERVWLYKSSFDYYNSLFAGLGSQEVLKKELYYDPRGLTNDFILGFNGRFDELRSRTSSVCGLLRSSKFTSYTLDRSFGSAPSLHSDFVHCFVDKSRFLAIPSDPTFVVHFELYDTAFRPMPARATTNNQF